MIHTIILKDIEEENEKKFKELEWFFLEITVFPDFEWDDRKNCMYLVLDDWITSTLTIQVIDITKGYPIDFLLKIEDYITLKKKMVKDFYVKAVFDKITTISEHKIDVNVAWTTV